MLEPMLMLAIGAVIGAVFALVVLSFVRGRSSEVELLVPPSEQQSAPVRVRRQTVPPAPKPAAPPEEVDGALLASLREGNKIAAIKRARELTGLGLREAKEYVEALERRNFIAR